MWTTMYKGYYIQGYCDKPQCIVQYSPAGYGYAWRKECKSLQAAKIAITRRINHLDEILYVEL